MTTLDLRVKCRTIKDWNALPSEIVNIKSAHRFKKSYLNILVKDEFLILHND